MPPYHVHAYELLLNEREQIAIDWLHALYNLSSLDQLKCSIDNICVAFSAGHGFDID